MSPPNIYLAPEAVPVAQAAIDGGARDVGRGPATIRRIYNVLGAIDNGPSSGPGLHGGPEHWAQTLAGWTAARSHSLRWRTWWGRRADEANPRSADAG